MDVEELDVTRSWVPTACTLPTAERPTRVAQFDELFAASVRRVERPDAHRLRLELEPAAEVAARAGALVVSETQCCSFFTFTLTAAGGRLGLEVSVPEGQSDVVEALQARVTTTGAR